MAINDTRPREAGTSPLCGGYEYTPLYRPWASPWVNPNTITRKIKVVEYYPDGTIKRIEYGD